MAPIKASHTIPRLELLSCYILATLMNTVHDAFKKDIDITQTFYWTDSTINLFRIRGLKTEYKQFVQNRLTEIRELSSADDWFYVPTKINPAGLPSRGCSITDLLENSTWKNDPEFMSTPNFDYKQFENKQLPLYVRDPELKLKPGDSLPELPLLTDIEVV